MKLGENQKRPCDVTNVMDHVLYKNLQLFLTVLLN